jgi:uncharacterized protein (DUF1501 family)
MLDRRQFLAGALALGLSPREFGLQLQWARRELARPKTIVSIYLRGGADALNVVVPYADSEYRLLRPGIGIPAEAEKPSEAVLKLDDRFGLHPALSGLMPLWKAKRFAPIVAVGSPHPTRSHFDAQDFMEYAAPGQRGVKEGWLNRYLQLPVDAKDAAQSKRKEEALRAVAIKEVLQRALRGRYPALAVSARRRRGEDALLDLFDPLYGTGETMEEMEKQPKMGAGDREEPGEGAVRVGRDTIATMRRLNAILDAPGKKKDPRVRYPKGSFGQGLATLAKIIQSDAGLESACLDLNGWDTHAQQGGATGSMANRLRNLGDGLGAFALDLGPRLDDVVVLVMTEFGRTCRENGTSGTDHGHGSFMFALGGNIAGGRVHGNWPGLGDKNLYQGRDLQVTTDFREVFRDVLEGFAGRKLPKAFFPAYVLARKRFGIC